MVGPATQRTHEGGQKKRKKSSEGTVREKPGLRKKTEQV